MTGSVATVSDRARSNDSALVLAQFKVHHLPLYVVGTLDKGVTVFSQQVRSLNLAWALTEQRVVSTQPKQTTRVAIVGGGFAGLTLGAALLRKGMRGSISLFERRDALLPLQQGCDARWLHPHIYDWPAPGSESPSAALPVLNWTAGRASDVAVQAIEEWRETVAEASATSVSLYCNTRHLHVSEGESDGKSLRVEWIGEARNAADPSVAAPGVESSIGDSQEFDVVILALGFGLERDDSLSYWRNETLAQPGLTGGSESYLVSGQGDGAMIDLLRLCIAQFRQDRILSELFVGMGDLTAELRILQSQVRNGKVTNLLREFERLWAAESPLAAEAREVHGRLATRLRHDTRVVLHVKLDNLEELFRLENVSFQNKLLVYLLYRCGGFYPSRESEDRLVAELGIAPRHVVRRHGTERMAALHDVLSAGLVNELEVSREQLHQPARLSWPGGYFGYRGRTASARRLGNSAKKQWRKEYLPGPTRLLASSFCAAVAGYLVSAHPEPGRLRVTFHRTLRNGSEELLQQCCEYAGRGLAREPGPAAAGRTLPANNATIGYARAQRRIVRSRRGSTWTQLEADMELLRLEESSRSMSSKVSFVMAVPVVAVDPERHSAAESVVGVLYLDSEDESFFITDEEVATLTRMSQDFIESIGRLATTPASLLANYDFWTESKPQPITLPEADRLQALEVLGEVDPPVAHLPGQVINIEAAQFARVGS